MRGKPEKPRKISWLKRLAIHWTPHPFLRRLRGLQWWYPSAEVVSTMRKPTAFKKAIVRYGKPFIAMFHEKIAGENYRVKIARSKYESSLCLGLIKRSTPNEPYPSTLSLVEAKLGFEKSAVIVEALQGKKEQKGEDKIRELNHTLKMSWPNFLLGQIEEHARACGFKQVKIRRPETMYYYSQPAFTDYQDPKAVRALQWNMRRLYSQAAKAMGYREGNDFYVKDL